MCSMYFSDVKSALGLMFATFCGLVFTVQPLLNTPLKSTTSAFFAFSPLLLGAAFSTPVFSTPAFSTPAFSAHPHVCKSYANQFISQRRSYVAATHSKHQTLWAKGDIEHTSTEVYNGALWQFIPRLMKKIQ